jgi:hypothetical protein
MLGLFDSLIDIFGTGIYTKDYTILRRDIENGRTSAEKRTTLFIKHNSREIDVLDIVLFSGFSPRLYPWIEISYPYDLGLFKKTVNTSYVNSSIEEIIISLCCKHLPPAGKLFVSYDSDDETRKALMMSIPPILSRLGYLLFLQGCTWFKDWYFPEGGLEGCQKLQGEKPLSNTHRNRQLDQQKKHILSYLNVYRSQPSHLLIETDATNRANHLLETVF